MIRYCVERELICQPGLKQHVGFAIAVYQPERQDSRILLHDVFLHLADAEQFVKSCNRLQLSPIQLPDVVEDFLGKD